MLNGERGRLGFPRLVSSWAGGKTDTATRRLIPYWGFFFFFLNDYVVTQQPLLPSFYGRPSSGPFSASFPRTAVGAAPGLAAPRSAAGRL